MMKIEVLYDEEDLYSVKVNGDVVLECLSEEEVGELTLAELSEMMLMYK